jgi:hypothetical protein
LQILQLFARLAGHKDGAGGAVLGFGGAYEATKSPKRRGLAGLENAKRRRRGMDSARRGAVCVLLFCLMNQRLSADSENFSR